MSIEVERKFRLKQLPSPEVLGEGTRVVQFYLFTDGGEMRVRRSGDMQATLTVKSEGSLSRNEWIVKDVPDWVHDLLADRAVGRTIHKTRYKIPHGDLTLEVDEYHEDLDGMLTLECEFPDEAASATLVLPDWAEGAVDVTADPTFKNKRLASA